MNACRYMGLGLKIIDNRRNAAVVFRAGLKAVAVGHLPVGAQVEAEHADVVPAPVRPRRADRDSPPALEGNLEGDAVEREAIVLLPPSYPPDPARRYPVLYALHGYSTARSSGQGNPRAQAVEGAFAQRPAQNDRRAPDSKTLHDGWMDSSSVTTGDFENFIARDLVAYVDAHYRTIPYRKSRGSSGTRWAAMAPRASASGAPTCSGAST